MIVCIPNVSEGRRPEVIQACAEAIRTSGAHLLHVSSDRDHNRTVYTIAGDAAQVSAAVMALFARAVETIDLRRHTGVHPRIGAVDVVPFVPIGDARMSECVGLARQVAPGVAERFHLPVFLYGEAALVPERTKLEDIRRGQFEGLASKLRDPAWRPDFGPARPHPSAGATVIGARQPLIAYNINLQSTDLAAAKAIARSVRERSGGLPGVKAMGVPLEALGLVQVSMNLTDYRQTSMATVFGRVKAEADRRGIAIDRSEIIGLVPAAAMPESPANLLLPPDAESQILERRLIDAGLGPPVSC